LRIYEWGASLIRAGHKKLGTHDGTLRVLLFNQLQHLDTAKVSAWLATRDGSETPSVTGVMSLTRTVKREAFEGDIGQILDLIRAGETYQVNYTYRLHGRQFGSPMGLYRMLRTSTRVVRLSGRITGIRRKSRRRAGCELGSIVCTPVVFTKSKRPPDHPPHERHGPA
jgi:para-aminobenzoate synthetase/4-amino-4-deoxychorismate lyase